MRFDFRIVMLSFRIGIFETRIGKFYFLVNIFGFSIDQFEHQSLVIKLASIAFQAEKFCSYIRLFECSVVWFMSCIDLRAYWVDLFSFRIEKVVVTLNLSLHSIDQLLFGFHWTWFAINSLCFLDFQEQRFFPSMI